MYTYIVYSQGLLGQGVCVCVCVCVCVYVCNLAGFG